MQLKMKNIRKQKKYTQQELAALIGTTTRKIGAWESGETPLPIDHAWAIADVLGCTLDELAGREVPKEWTDERQARLNKAFAQLDESRKDLATETLEDWADRVKPKSGMQDNSVQGIA